MSAATKPKWLDGDVLVRDISHGLIRLHLVRPEAFYAAMAAPQAAYYYGGIDDLCLLAASYAYHVAKAHALLDGNKRTAIIAALVFLAVHGYTCIFKGVEADDTLLALVTDVLSEQMFADFLRASVVSVI